MEVDLTKAEGAEEAAPAATEKAPTGPLPMSLLSTIKNAQAQNGLRHGDYMRYRKHCASRLQSLYKTLKMQHGRTKYQKRKLDVHNVTDVRHLHVLLFSAERAWAFAMELKKEAEARGAAAPEPRKRHHLIGRLAKAVLWAGELARISADRADTRGSLEAEAYAAWMGGNLLLERESDWEMALAKFTRAKKLWSELAKACPDLEGQALCLAQVEEMEPNIRYCNYRLSRAGGAVPADPAELLRMGGGSEGGGLPGLDLLQSKLAALAQEAQMAQAASTAYFEWMGTKHPVRHERVKLALHQATEFGTQADKVMDTDAGDALDQRLALYDREINALAEAKSHIRNAVKSLAGPDAESHFKELEALEVAVEGLRLQRTVQRSEALAANTAARFGAGLQRLALGKKIKDKEKHARPEDVARCCDVLSRQLEDLGDLGARLGGRAGEALHEAASARVGARAVLAGGGVGWGAGRSCGGSLGLAAQRLTSGGRAAAAQAGEISAARAIRTYHVAHALLAATGTGAAEGAGASGRALDAWALFSRAQERASAAAAALKGLPGDDAAAAVLLGGRGALLEQLAAVGAEAAAYKAVAQAELSAADLRAKEELQAGVGGLSLEQQAAAAAGGQPFLLDALDTWESFAGTPAGAAAAAGAARAAPRLYKPPYAYGAVPARPIMLDTASNCLGYPTLEHRLRRAEKKGVFTSLFGGWGAAAKK
ncbi:hypothetical protein HYH03_000634 [Edaphochlamys debaryana]|uniref:Signal recognition particle subunit SRP68 n=1 Tax=Edaphochlamys debaryana TaxID=47281 RepID=A0A835YHU6_9CHLO|nr:hypothetical protein HYH03_000634 [Edaphochlamys debaryana]|eukprot:KAG2502147.1 hypothetical protein HYH03_000634 [Edaphochlamys debaryana]